MLTFEEKIKLFENILTEKKGGYGDRMRDEIHFYFFENERGFEFIKKLNTQIEIEAKVEFVVSKMIIHEHEDGLDNIIEYHLG